MFKYLKKIENNIKHNKLLIGIVIIIINILSRNVSLKLSPLQKYLIDNTLVRQLLIFCITFTGTKDLKSSFILTASFYILSAHLLHEDSPINIIPKRLKKILDTNNDNVISQEEINNAISILEKIKLNN